jgi:HD-like signal output (HDOD) protein
MGDTFQAYIRKIEDLPTLPVTANQILNLADDPLFSLDKLKDILERDPAISAKILSVANSAFFGFPLRTNMLSDAIMRIGFDNVRSIALGISLLTLLCDGRTTPAYKRLFNHSITVGLTARLLTRNFRMGISDDILIDGMLHDLGHLVLNRYFPEVFEEILASLEREGSLIDAERSVMNYTHSDAGFWLAEKWNLPESVLDTSLYHHAPSQAKRNQKRAAVIHIADYIVSRNILSPVKKDANYPFDHNAIDILGFSDNTLSDLEESIDGIPFSDDIFFKEVR